jgi:hypothetical protein
VFTGVGGNDCCSPDGSALATSVGAESFAGRVRREETGAALHERVGTARLPPIDLAALLQLDLETRCAKKRVSQVEPGRHRAQYRRSLTPSPASLSVSPKFSSVIETECSKCSRTWRATP